MGGAQNHNEPNNIDIIQQIHEAFHIFSQEGCLDFLERFQGSNVSIDIEFAQTFNGEYTTL
jgi:hypothetical protein